MSYDLKESAGEGGGVVSPSEGAPGQPGAAALAEGGVGNGDVFGVLGGTGGEGDEADSVGGSKEGAGVACEGFSNKGLEVVVCREGDVASEVVDGADFVEVVKATEVGVCASADLSEEGLALNVWEALSAGLQERELAGGLETGKGVDSSIKHRGSPCEARRRMGSWRARSECHRAVRTGFRQM